MVGEDLLTYLLPALITASCLLAVVAGISLFNRGLEELYRESSELAQREAMALEAATAVAAAAAAKCPKTCSVCGKDAPLRCKGCAARAYCGQPCQLKDWRAGHKQQCKKLRAQQSRAEAAVAAQRLGAAPAAQGGEGAAAAAGQAASADGSEAKPVSTKSNTVPPIPGTIIFPYNRFLGLLEQPVGRSRPAGLANAGNTCFANSLLQPLLATQPLAAYLVSGEHSAGCSRRSGRLLSRGDFCLLCDLEALAQEAYGQGSSGDRAVLNPRQMLRNIKRIGKQFTFGHQEDSHELYMQMLDCMESSMLEEAGGKAKFDLRSRETTLVHHIFGGYLRNQVVCLGCGHVSKSFECSLSLPLEVPFRSHSLDAALQHFTKRERLDGDNKYKCDRCQAYVAADKSTQIEVAPNVLQICLKRFSMGRFVGKNRSQLNFPEHLDLGPYMADDCLDERPALYTLYGVVIHQGGSASWGHYVSYVRVGEKWYSCNDESVVPVAAHAVLKDSAYLLFYQRQTPRDIPTGPRSSPPTPAKPAAAREGRPDGEVEARAVEVSMLGRIQTAPAALSHMPDVASAAGQVTRPSPSLSPASSTTDLRAGAEEPPAGLPDRFHPSVSESNLLQSVAAGSSGSGQQDAEQPVGGPPCVAGKWREAQEAAELGTGNGADGDGGSSSGSEESEDGEFGPMANPFELLAGSDSNEEPPEEPGISSEQQRPKAGEAAAQPLAEGTGDLPVAAAACEGPSAVEQQQQEQQEQEGEEQPQLPQQQHGGGPGLANGCAERDVCCLPGSCTSASMPAYRLEQKQLDDGSQVVRLSVQLPGVQGEDIDLRVSDDRRQLWLGARPYSATLELPAPVDPVQRSVKWVKKSQRLVALFNISSS